MTEPTEFEKAQRAAFAEGAEDCKAGHPRKSNPHPMLSSKRAAWFKGYTDASRES